MRPEDAAGGVPLTLPRFFKKPDYDVEVARYSEKNKQPFAITELLTAATLQLQSLAFTGPAMVRTIGIVE